MSRSAAPIFADEILAAPAYRTLKISTTESADATWDAFAVLVIEMISCRAARANSAALVKGVTASDNVLPL